MTFRGVSLVARERGAQARRSAVQKQYINPSEHRRGSRQALKAERRNYYDHARGSAFESGSHLDIVRLLKCVPDEDVDKGKAMLVEIVKMLTVMMRT